jgi:NAD(P)-dependent dehydrogenase (short-subunit alcohol dehydrogenase family)
MAGAAGHDRKVVLITGAASGIGAAVAKRCAGRGSRVVLADIDEDRGRTVAADLHASFVRADVGSYADNIALVEAVVAEHGRIDVVHLNAGMIGTTSIGDTFDPAAYRRVLNVNLDSVVFGVQAALPALRAAGGGAIVVTASAAALRPSIEVIYSATKSAVIGLVRSLAPVLESDGITVNALCPGIVDTPLIDSRRAAIAAAGVPVAGVDLVVDAFDAALDGGGTGQAWLVMADRELAPVRFAELPVPGADRLSYRNGKIQVDLGG